MPYPLDGIRIGESGITPMDPRKEEGNRHMRMRVGVLVFVS